MKARTKDSFLNLLLAFIGCVVGLVLIGVAMNAFHLDFTIAAIVIAVLCLSAIAILPNLWKLALQRYTARDERETVMPIIHKYEDRHDVKALMADYRRWIDGAHARDLRIRFSRVIVGILIDEHRYKDARNELADLQKWISGRVQQSEYEEFREACGFYQMPSENMVWVDRKGTIGWQAAGVQPLDGLDVAQRVGQLVDRCR